MKGSDNFFFRVTKYMYFDFIFFSHSSLIIIINDGQSWLFRYFS